MLQLNMAVLTEQQAMRGSGTWAGADIDGPKAPIKFSKRNLSYSDYWTKIRKALRRSKSRQGGRRRRRSRSRSRRGRKSRRRAPGGVVPGSQGGGSGSSGSPAWTSVGGRGGGSASSFGSYSGVGSSRNLSTVGGFSNNATSILNRSPTSGSSVYGRGAAAGGSMNALSQLAYSQATTGGFNNPFRHGRKKKSYQKRRRSRKKSKSGRKSKSRRRKSRRRSRKRSKRRSRRRSRSRR